MRGMTGRTMTVNGVELWLEEFGAAGDPGVVLVPGAASASDWWDDEFCLALAAGGHRVVRYDLRDTGQSVTRRLGDADYTGDDLVDDLAALIVDLGLAPAHVVGLSLGGGLAQQLGIVHPELVRSLTLMSTSPGSDGLPGPTPELSASFAEEPGEQSDDEPGDEPDDQQPSTDLTARDAYLIRIVAEEHLFGGSIPVDDDRIRRIAGAVFDRSIDLEAGANQWAVPSASGTRQQLADITAPTLVVHGTDDPLFPPAHGEALAREIPDARLLLIPGLGHQFPPPPTWPQLVPALLEHFRAAQGPLSQRDLEPQHEYSEPTRNSD